jgi:hypothetical protein
MGIGPTYNPKPPLLRECCYHSLIKFTHYAPRDKFTVENPPVLSQAFIQDVKFKFFTAVTILIVFFWEKSPCGSGFKLSFRP